MDKTKPDTVVLRPDGGTTTFKHVAPPVRPAVAVQPVVPTAAKAEAQRLRIQGKRVMLTGSSIVHPGVGTEVRLSTADGHEVHAWSNLDFSLLTGTHTLTHGGVRYDYLLITTELPLNRKKLSDMPEGVPAMSLDAAGGFGLLEPAETGSDEAQTGLALLVDHLKKNRVPLSEAKEAREKERERALAEEAAKPPKPPPSPVIQIWTVKGGREQTRPQIREGGAARP